VKGSLYAKLSSDVRLQEGLRACINCGTCTAICPAASFYNYDPKKIASQVQSGNDEIIEALLKSETIWYCGECMSCKTRCPRGNTPGLIIIALRSLSQELGYFVESEKGRQQLAIKRTVGQWILDTGYCLYLKGVTTALHPEQGPVWDWIQENYESVFERLGANYQGEGAGILRKIPEEALNEIRRIFDETGGTERYNTIEKYSEQKAEELNLGFDETNSCEYFAHIYKYNSNKHYRD
jgi:heterodisulfide reductase subunit C